MTTMQRKLIGWTLLAAAWGLFSASLWAATSIPTSSAAPPTIIFTASDPDTPMVSGNLPATITFQTNAGSTTNTWQVQVQATTANFGTCPSTVPATVVRVTCGNATVTGGNGGGSGSCGGAFNLSTALQTVASGTEGTGSGNPGRPTYTVTLNFTFTDSWSYIATSSACTLGLSYTITAN